MRSIRPAVWLVLPAALALSACAVEPELATGPAFHEAQGEPGRATVYVYRMPSREMATETARFYLDGKRVAQLNADGYSYFYVTPGEHTLTQGWPFMVAYGKEVGFSFNVRGNETHYVRFEVDAKYRFQHVEYRWNIEEAGSAAGSSEILSRHLQEPEDARP